ncbi:hypothetical protein H7U19_12790 [Hyunsoonleella sp. SJ7]|uniref:Lipoprotein n=1 Tax=Hyunsoonleella aquatilis TaxID=2762758 RepID=A0A923HJ55_9FLAO|nr:hypothetical protein [Hyunsoonleella aquatilis]MBC3759287.1 hypothetical protein [Hyunsoonleella aquatilis]
MRYLRTSSLVLICFILFSCPAAHYYDYDFIDPHAPKEKFGFTRIKLDQRNDLLINVGYFYEYSGNRENGLGAVIKTENSINPNTLVNKVRSHKFGPLKKVDSLFTDDDENIILYRLIFEKRKERKSLRLIKNDTIFIELKNGKKLLFLRNQ